MFFLGYLYARAPLSPVPAGNLLGHEPTLPLTLGAPSCSGVGAGELVATAASPRAAGPFTPGGAWHEVSSFCHREGGNVCRNSSLHPTSVSVSVSLEKGSDSSFSDSHLSPQLQP